MYLDDGFTQEKYAELLKAAMHRNEPDALYELGMFWAMLGHQHDDQKRVADGMNLLYKSAEMDHAPSATYLGTIFQDGKFGQEKDMVKAVSWYQKGAELGDALGMSNYGIALQRGDGGLARDDAAAFEWIRKAADTDPSLGVAQYNTALALHAGRGTRVDRKAAKEYFKRAAAAGIGMAQMWLYSEDYKE